MLKLFAALLPTFEFAQLFWFNEIVFRFISNKIFRYFSKVLSVYRSK